MSVSVRDMARRLDEVEKNLRQSPTPNAERDLRNQIDTLTEKNRQLHEELDNARSELRQKKELLDQQRAKEVDLRVQLDESVERERLLKAKLDQADVRERLLRQEVRQAVQDERTQMTSVTTDSQLLSSTHGGLLKTGANMFCIVKVANVGNDSTLSEKNPTSFSDPRVARGD